MVVLNTSCLMMQRIVCVVLAGLLQFAGVSTAFSPPETECRGCGEDVEDWGHWVSATEQRRVARRPFGRHALLPKRFSRQPSGNCCSATGRHSSLNRHRLHNGLLAPLKC
ncbi:MAG: hypothetical protein RIK87_13375 [Fuerstiella sp.]